MSVEVLEDIYELSPMQEGMLFHTLYAPGSGMYCEQLACTLAGDLDVPAFQRAWEQVVDRHPVLRTAFHWQDLEKPVQVVYRQVEVPWEDGDWRGLSAAEEEARLAAYLEEERRIGFALEQAPLVRLALFRTGEDRHRFVLCYHHLLMDGWCVPLVLGEVLALYEAGRRGETPRLPRPRPYRDFILWLQRRNREGEEAFWRRTLAGFEVPTALPGDRRVPGTLTGAGGATEDYADLHDALSPGESEALQVLARSRQLTLNSLLQAAWAMLLSRASGEADIVFGATVSGRPGSLPGVESMIGLFINTLPVRVRVPREAPLLPWLLELQDRQAEAREHDHTPLAQIQTWSEAAHGQPLFESILVFENQPVESASGREGSFRIGDFRSVERTNYPLTLVVIPGSPLRLRATYDRQRLDPASMARALGHLRTLLAAMSQAAPDARLGDLPLLTAVERHQLVHEWAEGERSAPGAFLHHLIEEQAARSPEALAVLDSGGASLSYGELSRRANRLAHHLRVLGAGPDTLVGVCVERSPDLPVALLAVLKAGGAYLPLDAGQPAERLAWMLENSGARVLITSPSLSSALPVVSAAVVDLARDRERIAAGSDHDPAVPLAPDHLAYVLYTSGSTGRPKGTLVTHRGLANYLAWALRAYPVAAGRGAPVHSPIG
ncbi:MAG TPA: condensation domain-containing protein, partial [Thermoanaerobaculia bacterium]